MDGEELDDIWMFTWATQHFYQMLFVCFNFSFIFGCFSCQLNGASDVIELFNFHRMHGAPHHNHLDCLDSREGAHLMCLESIRGLDFFIWERKF
jgi:hypothetical protein